MQMQSPKTSTKCTSEGSKKISPRSTASNTTEKLSGRNARQLNLTGLEANTSSPNKPNIKIAKSTSPIISARTSPKTPKSLTSEKKHLGKVAELETQITQLEDALKTVKDQLLTSVSSKDEAQQDAEESKKQLLATSLKLEESQKLLTEFSSKESQETQELLELSEASEEAWKSKLDAAKRLHSSDLDALAVAINEISQLKVKLDEKVNSEVTQIEKAASANAEVQSLKETMAETLSLVETMKNEIEDCKRSESEALILSRETSQQLETAKKTIETLKLENDAQVDRSTEREVENRNEEEIISLKSEVEKLKSDVENAETRLNEEQSRRTMEITSAYELVEEMKFNSRVKESELEDELKKSKEVIEDLKANLMDKETELQGICEENEDLKLKVIETKSYENSDENEMDSKSESINKIDHLVEEIENSNRKVARVVEQLEAAQAANCEMEAELRKMKVQSDQWRKAAEAAATMVAAGNNNTNRKLMGRTRSMDNRSDDTDDEGEFLKKRNGNVLKRIGVLWKKPQNK
ncbi:interactor of constitutive active ROPs 2, chloroplastic-like isoform X2 [Rutidosis leptorrhynchoides]|uniref:interactor of constitutive active ROPs 2, chloroplastic-like isoform X2 n=1 Tax=Rutidosis leptorrhynchoides TaxID=125765 RepID=UPI003A9A19ED